MSAPPRSAWQALLFVLTFLTKYVAHGAFINFGNCLAPAIVNSDPQQLQWIPLALDAKFERKSPYRLSVTVYGNVFGQQVEGDYPPPDSPSWDNPNNTFGKIANIGSSGNYSTLLAEFKALQYSVYDAKASEFCSAVVNASCPLGPSFHANDTDPATLPAFSISHDFGSGYTFASLAGTVRVISGDTGAPDLACVSANITPDLGPTVTGLITWLPATILIVKGVATLAAAIWSPWGSSDIFRWSSNYGRDEDQLRLVTPGFGDCLQYIQFVTLTGALSLQYPGFYQPAVSQTSWSLLLFNESYVSHGNGTQSLVDGVYKYNGTYGMTAMSQLIGMTSTRDIWACMAVWLCVIAGVIVLLCQLGFLVRWIYRTATHTTEEDLRQKNLPFTLGNMIRLLFNYFILPIVALSLFQLVISARSPTSVVVCAVILLALMILSAGWILRVIFTTKPRTYLFDDMPTVLLYGPLYNTYSDSAAPFALVPVFITFMRAVALGAVQPSGIGQLIVLAICEVILILTLNGFRPFQGQTSMNAYHTFFAVVRLVAVLLSIAFVPSLNVSEGPKGWIGYAILLLHACVLVFGFFLNALQTLIEVIARSLGVAGDAQTGAIRGSILNLRMLQKRRDRGAPGSRGDRGSMTSNAAILQDSSDARSAYAGGRSRSMSASSQQLLNQAGGGSSGGAPASVHRLSGFENFSAVGGEGVGSPSADLEGAQAGFTYTPSGGAAGAMKNGGLADKKETETQTYYRPPRPRRTTLEQLATPGAKTRKSGGSGEYLYQDFPDLSTPSASAHGRMSSYEVGLGGGYPGRDSPAPAYFRDRADSNEGLNINSSGLPRTDYAVREVDQYYRGPALSDLPTRKLKTGPVDPEGPVAGAQSWFKRFVVGVKGGVGGKQKEPSKGFEVVRSSRMPGRGGGMVGGEEGVEMETSPGMGGQLEGERYLDSPPLRLQQGQAVGGAEAERAVSPVESEEDGKAAGAPRNFSFVFDGPSEVEPVRQDSGRAREIAAGQGPGPGPGPGPVHPVSRTEQPSVRAQRSLDAGRVSDYDRRRPSADTGSDYDARRFGSVDDEVPGPYRISGAPSLGPIESVGRIEMPSRYGSRRSAANLDHIHTDGGNQGGEPRDWLRDVENLSWNHERGSASALPASYQPSHSGREGRGTGYRSPPLPRRSSRRSPSDDFTPTQRLYGQHDGRQQQQQQQGPAHEHRDVFSGFDSAPTGPDLQLSNSGSNTTSDFLSAPGIQRPGIGIGDEELGRPHSFASVSHRRAGDSISRDSFGASAKIFSGQTPPAQSYLGYGEGGRL